MGYVHALPSLRAVQDDLDHRLPAVPFCNELGLQRRPCMWYGTPWLSMYV